MHPLSALGSLTTGKAGTVFNSRPHLKCLRNVKHPRQIQKGKTCPHSQKGNHPQTGRNQYSTQSGSPKSPLSKTQSLSQRIQFKIPPQTTSNSRTRITPLRQLVRKSWIFPKQLCQRYRHGRPAPNPLRTRTKQLGNEINTLFPLNPQYPLCGNLGIFFSLQFVF